MARPQFMQGHHFTLTKELLAATTVADASATLTDLSELGVLRLPYPECYVTANTAALTGVPDWQSRFELSDDALEEHADLIFHFVDGSAAGEPDLVGVDPAMLIRFASGREHGVMLDLSKPDDDAMFQVAKIVCSFLIAALAASNTIKNTVQNPRAAKGRGKGQFRGGRGIIYLSTTTLSPPPLATGTSAPVRPHLRRGHKHTFLCGVGKQQSIVRWVAPVFVNGNPAITPQPQNYVVQR